MIRSTVTARIARYNKGREPERLTLKYRAMRADQFAFLRGTCHLFYEDLPDRRLLRKAPLAWICGDLHVENFGAYNGDDRQACFDMNDFDEAALAPCTWEIVRTAASLLVAARTLTLALGAGPALSRRFLDAYCETLCVGKVRRMSSRSANGLIGELFQSVETRSSAKFIASRTVVKHGKRRIDTNSGKALPASAAQQERITAFMREFATGQDDPAFYKVIDVARRISGMGSLGTERYVVLVHGKGGPGGHYLIEIKQSLPSSLEPFLETPQPAWRTHAERVVTLQKRIQAMPTAFLHAVMIGRTSYALKALQPSQDKVNLKDARGNLQRLELLAADFGRITAWDHLRASGQQGADTADALADFGNDAKCRAELAEIAALCAERNERAWLEFASNPP